MILNISNNIYYKYVNVKNDKQRLEHEYQFYNNDNSFYTKLIRKQDGIIDTYDNSIIMKNQFDVDIVNNLEKLKNSIIVTS